MLRARAGATAGRAPRRGGAGGGASVLRRDVGAGALGGRLRAPHAGGALGAGGAVGRGPGPRPEHRRSPWASGRRAGRRSWCGRRGRCSCRSCSWCWIVTVMVEAIDACGRCSGTAASIALGLVVVMAPGGSATRDLRPVRPDGPLDRGEPLRRAEPARDGGQRHAVPRGAGDLAARRARPGRRADAAGRGVRQGPARAGARAGGHQAGAVLEPLAERRGVPLAGAGGRQRAGRRPGARLRRGRGCGDGAATRGPGSCWPGRSCYFCALHLVFASSMRYRIPGRGAGHGAGGGRVRQALAGQGRTSVSTEGGPGDAAG